VLCVHNRKLETDQAVRALLENPALRQL
jgi:hypothetical protein